MTDDEAPRGSPVANPASPSRRSLLTAALASTTAFYSGRAWAAYPDRSIKLIVPFAAGGGVDIAGRLLGKALSDNLGEAVVIDNRGGAGGITGMDAVAKSPADGYTLLTSHSGFTAMPGLYPKLPFDPVKDFDAVITATSGVYVLAVASSTPFKSVAELIAHAKSKPRTLTYGSAGIGSTVHLASEFFKRLAGVDILHVPYKGAGPALGDLVGGHIDMMFGPAVNILPLDRTGDLRAFAVTSAARSAMAPNLPTVAESGLDGFEVVGWYGLAAPAGTPEPVITRLNSEINRALRVPALVEQLQKQGLDPVGGTPRAAQDLIRLEVERWTRIIREAGIVAQ